MSRSRGRGSQEYTYDGNDYKKDKWYEDNGLVNPQWEQDEGTSWVDKVWDPWREANGIPTKGNGDNSLWESSNKGNSGGNSGNWGGGNNSHAYEEAARAEAEAKAKAEEAYRKALEEEKRQRQIAKEQSLKQLGMTREEAMRQVYLRGEQQKALLPEQLQSMGLTGGGSETLLQGSLAGQQNALNNIESQYMAGVQDLESKFQSGVAMDTAETEGKIAQLNEKHRQEQLKITEKLADREYNQRQAEKNKLDELKKQVYLNGVKKGTKNNTAFGTGYYLEPLDNIYEDDYLYNFLP